MVLDQNENFVDLIEGRVTGGNINVNGKSAIRRTGSLSMIVDKTSKNITNVDNIISINKKVDIEIGLDNISNNEKYSAYDIIWFPIG
jgi:hypothetical protein